MAAERVAAAERVVAALDANRISVIIVTRHADADELFFLAAVVVGSDMSLEV